MSMASSASPSPPAAGERTPRRWSRVRYRIRQFWLGVGASLSAHDWTTVRDILSPAQCTLFERMPVDAQDHSLRVLAMMQAQGDVGADLAVAALLHDVGKVAALESGAYLGLWLRGPMVVVEALAPGLLERLADSSPSASVRYALYVQQHHAAIGAQWAREAGSTPLTCWLIEHHQDKQLSGTADERSLLARLQAADGAN